MAPKDDLNLSFWEKADIPFVHLSLYASMLYAAVTGIFRGKASPKRYDHHIIASVIRKLVDRSTDKQKQYINSSTGETYAAVMKKRGLALEVVPLPHDTEGYWLGNKNAKNVIVYYHGGGFAMPASAVHFEFWLDMLSILNGTGQDVAVFFPRYSLTPHTRYPTQLRQAVEALRHIIVTTGRSASNVIIGGDSAGGNLASATLLHLSHPHPEIEPLPLDAPLAGVFAYAPWISFSTQWPSMESNRWKDIITPGGLIRWAQEYVDGKVADNWNEPLNAPAEWWAGARTERILILVGSDEILLSPVEEFVKKIQSVFPKISCVVGTEESHDAPFYTRVKEEMETTTELKQWLAARL
ncbi:uncharacterized protein N7515_004736 [Penicillium bovifimosum]|uniref:Alpha/beta hydrolase fold-3 domain-containing protein n=1 Tax=Penicillium bovifimosum TaxID=126998 RepID=A0A9W9H289_9EURO|nr:uncharacterized protein N7515_004736 [Penicillium bovifimosum]KAJ5135458.1 hypothetical protein N7515_004736 [Penicillium bovifimosum]